MEAEKIKFKKHIILVLVIVFLLTTSSFGNLSLGAESNLQVHIIDVGQGDSIYLSLPNGENMLVDGGPGTTATQLITYLQNRGVNTINYVVATHPHEDHIGGLDNVISTFTIGKVYMPAVTYTTQAYTNLINAISSKGLTSIKTFKGVVILNTTTNAKNLSIMMLSPISATYSDINNYSPFIRVVYGTTEFLLTGDAGTIVETEVKNSGQTMYADVLKVAHHGSNTATDVTFLNDVNPSSAAISVGSGNTDGHPTVATLDKLKAKNINIFRTDLQGSVVYTTNGTGYLVNVVPWFVGMIIPTSGPIITAAPTSTPTPTATVSPKPTPKPAIHVKSVKLNKTSLSILKGKTFKLIPTINPSNSSNKKVTWKSSNVKIASVSSTGTVKGIKKGIAYIMVVTVDGKKSAKCKVVVK